MIRIFVGCAANNEDLESQAVLEHSLRRHASAPLSIEWMRLSRNPRSFQSFWYSDGARGWRTDLWSTPFSGFRWAVPERCGFKGRAIYMDSDIIVRADIAELWKQALEPGKVLLAKGGGEAWRYCVTLFDCEAVKRFIPPIDGLRRNPAAHRAMIDFFKRRPGLVQRFAGNWNCIDGEDYADLADPDIKAIHYSSEAHQPHLRHALPRLAGEGGGHWFDGEVKPHWRPDLVALFDAELTAAIAAGHTPESYRNPEPFGAYRKKSERHYRSHQWAR